MSKNATTTDGVQILTIQEGFTARFFDDEGQLLSHWDFAPSDAAAVLAMVPSGNYASFRAVLFAARHVAQRNPVTPERVTTWLAV